MSQNEIMAMAREAGGYESPQYPENLVMDEHDLSRFAALVAAREREACRKIADDCADAHMHASMAANAIRARGQK